MSGVDGEGGGAGGAGDGSSLENAIFSPWRIVFGVGLEQSPSCSSGDDSQTASPIHRSIRSRTPTRSGRFGAKDENDSPLKKPASFTSEVQSFVLNIWLKEGHDLVIRDSCGTSDPYVKFKIDGKQCYKSRTILKNLNPRWDERFTIPLGDPSKIVQLKVYDYDRGLVRDDPMGEAIIETGQLDLNLPTDLKLLLSDSKKQGKALKSEYMGYLLLEVTLVQKIAEEEPEKVIMPRMIWPVGKSNSESKKIKTQLWNSVVTVVLVEGRHLVAMDDNGFSDPYIKFRLGNEKYKSKLFDDIRDEERVATLGVFGIEKYKPKNLNPKWLEQFDLYMYDNQSSLLEISVFDRDVGGRDDIMGRAVIDLSQLEVEKTHSIEQQLEDGAGVVHLLVSISGQSSLTDRNKPSPKERESIVRKYGLLKSFKNFSDVGWLSVKVFKAEGLAAADLGGKSDPYCVLELVNNRLQTHTEYKTLAPEWGKLFIFDVQDIHSVLEITVYDEDKDKKAEFLGHVSIPLLRIPCGERKWYILKDKKLLQPSKGAIELEMDFIYNDFKAALRTFNPREVKYMQPDAKFKVAVMKRNIDRVSKIIEAVLQFGKFVQSCFEWESKLRSCLAFTVFVIVVLNFEMYMLPLTLLIIFAKNLVVVQLIGQLTKIKDEEDLVDLEEDDDDDEKESKEGKKSFREKLQSIQEVCLQVQEAMDMVASLGERIKNAFMWSIPWLSGLAIAVLLVLLLVLYYVPLRYLVLIWGINKFTKQLRNGNAVVNNELLDYLSRVPSDTELLEYRELRFDQATAVLKKRR